MKMDGRVDGWTDGEACKRQCKQQRDFIKDINCLLRLYEQQHSSPFYKLSNMTLLPMKFTLEYHTRYKDKNKLQK